MNRQPTFEPILLPDDQEALEFLLSLSDTERNILANGGNIYDLCRLRGCSFSAMARYLVKAVVALKKFQ